jgi:hypothetical protein
MSELVWVKSARSGADGCIEAALSTEDAGVVILMRDSKDPSGPVLRFTWLEWFAFIEDFHGITERLTRH